MNSFKNILGAIIVFVAKYFVSWAMVTPIIWVIFKLLGLTFSIKVSTGIWLIIVLIDALLVVFLKALQLTIEKSQKK